MGGVLAIDYGDKKCGFASTDALRLSLQALEPLRHDGREELLLAHVERLLAEREVSTLLLGIPLEQDGGAGERARAVLAFAERLRARFPAIPVRCWDERLTTKEAESRMREQGRRARELRYERDKWSAGDLVEGCLRSGGAGREQGR